MKAIAISPFTNFKTNRWGILEPVGSHAVEDIDVAVVPMVAFDGLKRAGHGKGYYDRYLAEHDCFVIGLAFDCQEVEGLETNAFDVPLDMLVTEKESWTKTDKEKIRTLPIVVNGKIDCFLQSIVRKNSLFEKNYIL